MAEALRKFVKSRLFKELLAVLIAALSGYGAAGCGLLPEARSPAADVVDCQVAVLRPLLGDLAGQAALQIDGGAVSPVQLFLSLGLSPEAIVELAQAYLACAPEPAAPAEPQMPRVIEAY